MGNKDKPEDISKINQDDETLDKLSRREKPTGGDEVDQKLNDMLGAWKDAVDEGLEDK